MEVLSKEELKRKSIEMAKIMGAVTDALEKTEGHGVVAYSPFVAGLPTRLIEEFDETVEKPAEYEDVVNYFWLYVNGKVYHLRPEYKVWYYQENDSFIMLYESEYESFSYAYISSIVTDFAEAVLQVGEEVTEEGDTIYRAEPIQRIREKRELPEEERLPKAYSEFNPFVQGLIIEYGWSNVRRALKEMGSDLATKKTRMINSAEKQALRDITYEYYTGEREK